MTRAPVDHSRGADLLEQRRNIVILGRGHWASSGMMYVLLYPPFKDTLNQYLKEFPEAYSRAFASPPGVVGCSRLPQHGDVQPARPLALPFFPILLGARASGDREPQDPRPAAGKPCARWQLV